jgi:1,4-alpha-glucan branching enzyme
VRDLNRLYAGASALHAGDGLADGFAWLVGDDRANSVFAFLRRNPFTDDMALVVFNFTPIVRNGYRIGVPQAGLWRERLNSDAAVYGGSNVGNGGAIHADAVAAHGHVASLALTLPPLAGLVLEPVR